MRRNLWINGLVGVALLGGTIGLFLGSRPPQMHHLVRSDRARMPFDEAAFEAKIRKHLFDRENLIAWCIVPFDGKKRGPEARAEMLARLGFSHFAYDGGAGPGRTFDAEVGALAKHKVGLDAFWCPGELNGESKAILDLLGRRGVRAELWVMLGLGNDIAVSPEEGTKRVENMVASHVESETAGLYKAAGMLGYASKLKPHLSAGHGHG